MLVMAMLCLFLNTNYAQLREPFSNLNVPLEGNTFFLPQSFNTVRMPDAFADTTTLTASQCAALFMSMGRASIDSTHILTDFSGFRERKDSAAHGAGCYSLALMDLEYFDLQANALSDGMLYRQNGQFYHAPGCTQSPCIKYESLLLWVDAPTVKEQVYYFVMSQESYVSNYGDEVDSVFVDFDDGQGWRVLHSEVVMMVDYSAEQRDRVVRCKLHRSNRPVKFSRCKLLFTEEYNVCANSDFPFPSNPPWPSETSSPWDVATALGEIYVTGRAYTLVSADGVFDKPFVFVEGIDFGVDRDGHPIHDWYRHGTFGWCEFVSGFQDPNVNDDIIYGYDDLHLLPQLLSAARDAGYDLVLIDFFDGATWLQHNSALVQHVIRLCNEYKIGHEPIVVAGASMGGVLSRHALRTMELNGEDHCTRLWISMDAPHEGAHIPLSLQHAIRFGLEHGQEGAQLFRDRYLLRPAATQMLDAQVFHSLLNFNQWYDALRELGYPQKCRSVALSNGRANGAGLNYSNDELMDWACDAAGLVHSKMLLLPESGDPNNSNSLPGNPVLAHFKLPIAGAEAFGDEWYFWFGGLILGVLDLIDIDEEIVHTSAGLVNRDYAPGGKRNTIQVFAKALNQGLDDLEESLAGISFCGNVSPSSYNSDHTFVLSQSAVGLQLQNPYTHLQEYLWQHPEENHFDRVWFAQNHNENHTEITQQNIEVVLEELIAPETSTLDSVLTSDSPNNGVFNFGRPEYSYIRTVHIHDEGYLLVNAMMNTHYNEANDYVSTQAHFELNTLPCSPEVIRVDNNGLLSIGDANEEYRTGQLTIGRDSKLIIGGNGRVVVHEGSTLVIEDGGLLEIAPGGVLQIESGNVIIRSGGICRLMGLPNAAYTHRLILSGNDARILLDGGQIQLDDLVQLKMDEDVLETGYLEVASYTAAYLDMGHNARFTWSGHGPDDLILKITNSAQLRNAQWMQGKIELGDGLVDLTYHGVISTDAWLSATNVHFFASDLWEAELSEVCKWYGAAFFEDCRFEHVELRSLESKLTIRNSDFIGPNSGIQLFEGAFVVSGCEFENATCNSTDLQAPSVVSDSKFNDNSGLIDWSAQQLIVRNCDFQGSENSSIDKTDGLLSVECSNFKSCGPITVSTARLDMSMLLQGGKNSFRSVSDCIVLNEAQGLYLEEGANDFAGCYHRVLEGTYDTSCVELECEFELMAQGNHWGFNFDGISQENGLMFPPHDLIRVSSIEPSVCAGWESGISCHMRLIDLSPIEPVRCQDVIKQQASTPSMASTMKSFLEGKAVSAFRCEISVYDIQGRLVTSCFIEEGSFFSESAFSLASGLFVITVRSDGEKYSVRRFIE